MGNFTFRDCLAILCVLAALLLVMLLMILTGVHAVWALWAAFSSGNPIVTHTAKALVGLLGFTISVSLVLIAFKQRD